MAIDPQANVPVRLFHPVQQRWPDDFRFNGYIIEGLTSIGRATVAALDLNHPRRREIRVAEQRFGLYSPAS
jgi:hypothetical protein